MGIRKSHIQQTGLYFITFTNYNWLPLFELSNGYDLVYTWYDYLKREGHSIISYVIMPNHLHLILGYKESSKSINSLVGNGKRFMAYEIVKRLKETKQTETLVKLETAVNLSDKGRGKRYEVFRDSFDLQNCYSQKFILQKLKYIHDNPCAKKWMLANNPSRLRTIVTLSGDEVQDLNYYYDAVGNVTQIRDDAQEDVWFNNTIVTPKNDYTYDSLYRLIKAEGREKNASASFGSNDNNSDVNALITGAVKWDGSSSALQHYTQHYTYDEVGNILSLQHVGDATGSYTRDYNYSSGNSRLNSTDVGATNYPYTYDNRGNMLTMPHLTAMLWNPLNELQKTTRGTTDTYFNYSGGERIRKVAEKTGGIKEERIYLGSYEIYRKFVSGSLTIERTTVHISDDTGRIAMLEEATVGSDAAPASLQRYIYSNHLQTASLELDENADIVSYEEYHPFGTTAYQASNSAINALAKRYRYTGKERDEETGLYYHGARYYIPWLAVWTAIDPMEADYAGMSPYNYAFNNPVMLNDPSGADPQTSQGPNSNIPQNNSGVVGSGDGWRAHGDGTFKIDLGMFHNGNKSSGGNGGGSGGGSGNKKAPDKKAPDKKKTAPAPPSSPGGGSGGGGGSQGGSPPPSLINLNIRQVTPIDALRNNVVVRPNSFEKPDQPPKGSGAKVNSIVPSKPLSEENTAISTPKKAGELFNVKDAENGLRFIYDNYGREMAITIERMYRDETSHFKSGQYKHTGTGGMEAGKWNMDLFKEHPEYTPVGTWSAYENKGSSGLGGNIQVKDRPKVFLVFPSVNAAMIYKAEYIKRHNGNFARWHTTVPATQEFYRNKLLKIRTPIVNSFK